MRNVITSPAQLSIGSCVHANLTVFNCMSPRSMENIASQFTSEKAHRLFFFSEKKHLLVHQISLSLQDRPDCRYGVHFISQAKLPEVTAALGRSPGQTCHGPESSLAMMIATVGTRSLPIWFVLPSDVV